MGAQLIEWLAPRVALDIGAGSGKYGRLLAEAAPDCERVAIEANESLLAQHGLGELYHQVDVADAAQWWRANPDEVFDLVIAGNCLEALPKSAGLDLLNAMVYRSSWVLVVTSEFVIQGAVEGADTAVHRSVWSERDFHWHDLWAWDNVRATTWLLLRGYQPSTLTIDTVVSRVNEGNVSLLDFDGQAIVRPCRLRLVDHAREVAYRTR